MYKHLQNSQIYETHFDLFKVLENYKPGDKVEIGQEIGVIEAMKMHNSIRAEKAAIVAEVVVATGDSIDVDQKLIIYEE